MVPEASRERFGQYGRTNHLIVCGETHPEERENLVTGNHVWGSAWRLVCSDRRVAPGVGQKVAGG